MGDGSACGWIDPSNGSMLVYRSIRALDQSSSRRKGRGVSTVQEGSKPMTLQAYHTALWSSGWSAISFLEVVGSNPAVAQRSIFKFCHLMMTNYSC